MVELRGAAIEFAARRFGGLLRERQSAPTIGTSAVELLGADPERVFYIIVNLSPNDMHVSFRADVSATNGILIIAQGGSMEVDVESDGNLSALQLFGVAAAAASQLFILELRRETITPLEAA